MAMGGRPRVPPSPGEWSSTLTPTSIDYRPPDLDLVSELLSDEKAIVTAASPGLVAA